jgi:hypothetical protein
MASLAVTSVFQDFFGITNGNLQLWAPRKIRYSPRADQRDPLPQLEWIELKATTGPIFRGTFI